MIHHKRKLAFEGVIEARTIGGEELNKIVKSIRRETVGKPEASEDAKKGTAKEELAPLRNEVRRGGRIFDKLRKRNFKSIKNLVIMGATRGEDLKDNIDLRKINEIQGVNGSSTR